MMLTRRVFTTAAAGLALTPMSRAAPMRANPVVTIASGKLRGRARGEVAEFLGIPYGADTRSTRFEAPRPATAWKGTRDALAYGPSCPQGTGGEAQSENCLVFNVWTPTLESSARKPVLVYIHGGGYSDGSGSSPVTDGAELARRGDAVVLTLNHRLNVFGHLYPCASCTRGALCHQRQCGPARSCAGAALGAGQHRGVRRRSRLRDACSASPAAAARSPA